MYRCGNSAAAGDKFLAGLLLYGHNRGVAEQTAKLRALSDTLTYYGNNSHGGGLVVDNADRNLVGYDA